MSPQTELARRYLELSPAQRKQVHLRLCERALEVWATYIATSGEIRYLDSIVGMRHTVDGAIPALALEAARDGEDLCELDHRYAEPLAALQDGDFELPDRVELAYYALYNLFRKYVLGSSVDGWLIVNQALAAVGEGEWERAFERALTDVDWR